MSENENINENEQNAEGEEVFTWSEVIQMQEEIQSNAYAVLGAIDDKNCTYPEVIHFSFVNVCLILLCCRDT